MAMCCGLVVNECGGCIKTAPLKFTFVIHLFVPNSEENQVFLFGNSNEPLVGSSLLCSSFMCEDLLLHVQVYLLAEGNARCSP